MSRPGNHAVGIVEVRVLAVFVVVVMMILAGLLQREQMVLNDALNTMCEQRRANAEKSVAYYDGMIAIERENTIQPPKIVEQRIALWQAAKPTVPTCEGPPRS